MVPTKSTKTYGNRKGALTSGQPKSAEDVMDALFVKNIKQRIRRKVGKGKKPKLKIVELPPRSSPYFTDESLKISADDTFDKLKKTGIVNKVNLINGSVRVQSSDSDPSKSRILHNHTFHSPAMTTRRKRKYKAASSKPRKLDSTTDESSAFKLNSKFGSPVDVSLSVEKIAPHKVTFSSLSYLKMPKILEHEASQSSLQNSQSCLHCSRIEATYEPVFSRTFLERQTVHSSTPCLVVPSRRKKIVADLISPIKPTDPESKLIEKSYDEIRKWDSSFPTDNPSIDGSKLQSSVTKQDWKLSLQPKVYLSPGNFKGFNRVDLESSMNYFRNMRSGRDAKLITPQKRLSTRKSGKLTDLNVMALRRRCVVKKPISVTKTHRSSINGRRKSVSRSVQSQHTISLFSSDSSRKSDVLATSGFSVNGKRTNRMPSKSENCYVDLSRSNSFNRESSLRSPICKVLLSPKLERSWSVTNRKLSPTMSRDTTQHDHSYSKMEDAKKDWKLSLEPKVYVSPMETKRKTSEPQLEVRLERLSVSTEDSKKPTRPFAPRKMLTRASKVNDSNFMNLRRRCVEKSLIVKLENSEPKVSPRRISYVDLTDSTISDTDMAKSGRFRDLKTVSHDHSYSSTPSLSNRMSRRSETVNDVATNSVRDLYIESLSEIIEGSCTSLSVSANFSSQTGKVTNYVNTRRRNKARSIKLKPGKQYRRNLSLLRRSVICAEKPNVCSIDCTCSRCLLKRRLVVRDRTSIQFVPVWKSRRKSAFQLFADRRLSYARPAPPEPDRDNTAADEDLGLEESIASLSLNVSGNNAHNTSSVVIDAFRKASLFIEEGLQLAVTAREIVLRRCGQTEPLLFEKCYPQEKLRNCQKIGEGVYGEVFLFRNQNGTTSVMKIIPIEGDLIVNGERQKKFDEILSEIVIAMELSNLRGQKRNATPSYSEVRKVSCVQGSYPDRLVELWELWDETRGSENDSPLMFPEDQLYIILELANGGCDLEAFVFTNAKQAFSMFKQTACALAVGESQLGFEHRDLHWGNVLLTPVNKTKKITCRLDGKDITIDSYGVEVSIIDFTLSRIEYDGVVIFNDMSKDDDLFTATGDYQFEIYRRMQKANENNWQHFEPYSNILWLHYLLDKAVVALRYKSTKTKLHAEYLETLRDLKDEILNYASVSEFVTSGMFIEVF